MLRGVRHQMLVPGPEVALAVLTTIATSLRAFRLKVVATHLR
jgi:hypothetical protein